MPPEYRQPQPLPGYRQPRLPPEYRQLQSPPGYRQPRLPPASRAFGGRDRRRGAIGGGLRDRHSTSVTPASLLSGIEISFLTKNRACWTRLRMRHYLSTMIEGDTRSVPYSRAVIACATSSVDAYRACAGHRACTRASTWRMPTRAAARRTACGRSSPRRRSPWLDISAAARSCRASSVTAASSSASRRSCRATWIGAAQFEHRVVHAGKLLEHTGERGRVRGMGVHDSTGAVAAVDREVEIELGGR